VVEVVPLQVEVVGEVHLQEVEVVEVHINLEEVVEVVDHHLVVVVVVGILHQLMEVVVVEELLVQEVVEGEGEHLLSQVEEEVVELVCLQNLHSWDMFVFQSCVSYILLSTPRPWT